MRRQIAGGLAILAVVAGVGWKLASHPGTSAGLQEVSLKQHSEHSQTDPTNTLAGIRIRLSGSNFGFDSRTAADKVPQISLAAE